MSDPKNDPNMARALAGRDVEQVPRGNDTANAAISEGMTQEEQSLPGLPPDDLQQLSSHQTRQCWICFFSEDDDDQTRQWVQPCLCSGTLKWVHNTCIQQWVDQKFADDQNRTPFCPHCQTKYLIYYPDVGALARFLDRTDVILDAVCPWVLGIIIAGSLYWTPLCIGTATFLEAGDIHADRILKESEPLVVLLSMPLIPAVIVGFGILKWEESALEFLRAISHRVSLAGYLLPNQMTNATGIDNNRQISDGMSCTRAVAGCAVFPLAAKWCGDTFFGRAESPFLRFFYGGLTLIGLKSLVTMFHHQQTYKRFTQRRILDLSQDLP